MKTIKVGRVVSISNGDIGFIDVTNKRSFEVSEKKLKEMAKVSEVKPDEIYEIIDDGKDYTSILKIVKYNPQILKDEGEDVPEKVPAKVEPTELKFVDDTEQNAGSMLPTISNFKKMKAMLKQVDKEVIEEIRAFRIALIEVLVNADMIEPDEKQKMLITSLSKTTGEPQTTITKNGAYYIMNLFGITIVGWWTEPQTDPNKFDVIVKLNQNIDGVDKFFFGKATCERREKGKGGMDKKAIEATAKTRGVKHAICDYFRLWHVEGDVEKILKSK